MTTKPGAYLGGIRTLEDLRGRCRINNECGCWIWSMGQSNGRPAVTIKVGDKHKSIVGRRAAYILAGKGPTLTKKDVVRQGDQCPNMLCVNPAHGVLGTHADAWQAAHKRNGWKRTAQAHASGERLKRLMAKLDDTKAAEIRASNDRKAVLAERYGVSVAAISLVLLGKTWVSKSVVNSVFSLAGRA